jgi:hypothetical protein
MTQPSDVCKDSSSLLIKGKKIGLNCSLKKVLEEGKFGFDGLETFLYNYLTKKLDNILEEVELDC